MWQSLIQLVDQIEIGCAERRIERRQWIRDRIVHPKRGKEPHFFPPLPIAQLGERIELRLLILDRPVAKKLRLVSDHTDHGKLRKSGPSQVLQPPQKPGYRGRRHGVRKHGDHHVVTRRQRVDTSQREPRRAIEQNEVEPISDFRFMKDRSQPVTNVVGRNLRLPAMGYGRFNIPEFFIGRHNGNPGIGNLGHPFDRLSETCETVGPVLERLVDQSSRNDQFVHLARREQELRK